MNWHDKPMMYIHQRVIGAPRPRARNTGGFARVYNPPEYTDWKHNAAMDLKAYWKHEQINGGYISLSIDVVCSRPKSLTRKKDPDGRIPHNKKPDVDNIAKAVMDSMVEAGIMSDDKLVNQLFIRKWYGRKNPDEPDHIAIHVLHTKKVALVVDKPTPQNDEG